MRAPPTEEQQVVWEVLAYREVCGAFAIFTLAVFASAGMALPDWSFPTDQARKTVAAWLSRPRLLSILNPLCIAVGGLRPLRFCVRL